MRKKIVAAISRHEREVAELRADRELGSEYIEAAMESLGDPNDHAAGLLALRTVAEAYGGLWVRPPQKLAAAGKRYAEHLRPRVIPR